MTRIRVLIVLLISSAFLAGCAVSPGIDIKDLPPTAAGGEGEYLIDNGYVSFFSTGEWKPSTVAPGYEGENYLFSSPGTGNNVATWNLNIIKTFDVFAKWTAHQNRGSNVKYVIHHLNDNDNLVTDTVLINQKENGGQWFKLGTYRMSGLTGRVTTSDDADGYVIADAILFREVGTGGSIDTDGDGMPDQWEISFGLDPNDPTDASLDLDGDVLTSKEEFLFLTDPTVSDTDNDGIPDGFEVSYGLDPTTDDSGLDSDQDGLTNYHEYLANTDPRDSESKIPSGSVLLYWTAPTERDDGTSLSEVEIASYEISYQKSSSAMEVVIDNQSSNFISYGRGSVISSSKAGYIGSDYVAMPAGSGEIYAEWMIYSLSPGSGYELAANWTSSWNRGSNVVYQYTYVNDSGIEITEETEVDQKVNGGSWQQLANFETSDPVVTVRVDNNADGYVIADAIRLKETPPAPRSIIVEPSSRHSYVIDGLAEGEWQFKIRTVDSGGLKSVYSEVQTHEPN